VKILFERALVGTCNELRLLFQRVAQCYLPTVCILKLIAVMSVFVVPSMAMGTASAEEMKSGGETTPAIRPLRPDGEFKTAKPFVMVYQLTKIDGGGKVHALDQLGMQLCRVSYEGRFGFRNKGAGKDYFPSDRILDRAASDIRKDAMHTCGRHAILDIERWSVGRDVDQATALINAGRYKSVFERLRLRLPGYAIGNYGLPVYRDYRATAGGPSSGLYQEWVARNTQMQPIADDLDLFLPTLYAFEKQAIEKWVAHAKAHVSEARRLARKGQKIIPFIWPQYHDRSKYAGQFIGYDFWKVQLETLYSIADGVFIWSNQSNYPSPDDEWFRATRDFVEEVAARGTNVNEEF
jgi:hypothetical protein